MKRLLHAAGWVGLAIGVAAAALLVLPLQPSFILPTLDDSFAATLHYAAAHRGEPGTALISTYGPLGFVHYPLYLPETFTALVWWRLAMAALVLVPLDALAAGAGVGARRLSAVALHQQPGGVCRAPRVDPVAAGAGRDPDPRWSSCRRSAAAGVRAR
jgi:hypothetical protein